MNAKDRKEAAKKAAMEEATERLKNLKTRYPYLTNIYVSSHYYNRKFCVLQKIGNHEYTMCDHGVQLRYCRQGCHPFNKKLQPIIVKKKKPIQRKFGSLHQMVCGDWRYKFTVNGKLHYEKFKTKKKAEEFVLSIRKLLESG